MVKGDSLKIIRDMAKTTVAVGRYMTVMFTRGHNAVVTNCAISVDASVVKAAV